MIKRFALFAVAAAALACSVSQAHAWGRHGGYRPFCNHCVPCPPPEDQRLQRFWHGYYNALEKYYGALDGVDWVAYYKNHGYPMPGADCGAYGNTRVHYYPVVSTPTLQWMNPAGPPPTTCGDGCGAMIVGN